MAPASSHENETGVGADGAAVVVGSVVVVGSEAGGAVVVGGGATVVVGAGAGGGVALRPCPCPLTNHQASTPKTIAAPSRSATGDQWSGRRSRIPRQCCRWM